MPEDTRPIKDLYRKIIILRTNSINLYPNSYKKKWSKVIPSNYYQEKNVDFDYQFKLNKFTNKKFGSKNFDKNIKLLCLKNKNNVDLLLLLRCKVSWEVKKQVLKLYYSCINQFKVYFDLQIMFSILLDDLGAREIFNFEKGKKNNLNKDPNGKDEKKSKDNIKNKINKSDYKGKNILFNYLYLENELKRYKELILKEEKRMEDLITSQTEEINELKDKGYKVDIIKTNQPKKYFRLRPFSAEVIYSFNHERNAEIQRWTEIKVQGDRELKKYLHPYMILLLKSDQALLGENDLDTILIAWKRYFKISDFDIIEKNISIRKKDKLKKLAKLQYLQNLINYFLKYWKDEKNDYEQNNKGEKWNPLIDDFLSSDDWLILRVAALCLRKHLGTKEFKDKFNRGLNDDNVSQEDDLLDKLPNHNKNIDDPMNKLIVNPFAEFTYKFINSQKNLIMNQRYLDDKKTFKTYPEREKAWIEFSKIDIESTYMRNNIKGELTRIAEKCFDKKTGQSRNISWLTKRFTYDDVLYKVFERYKNELIEIAKERTNEISFIEEYNKTNQFHKIDYSIIASIREQIIKKSKTKDGQEKVENIFKDDEEIKKFRMKLQNFLNPKKGRKRELILLVRKILKENN